MACGFLYAERWFHPFPGQSNVIDIKPRANPCNKGSLGSRLGTQTVINRHRLKQGSALACPGICQKQKRKRIAATRHSHQNGFPGRDVNKKRQDIERLKKRFGQFEVRQSGCWQLRSRVRALAVLAFCRRLFNFHAFAHGIGKGRIFFGHLGQCRTCQFALLHTGQRYTQFHEVLGGKGG